MATEDEELVNFSYNIKIWVLTQNRRSPPGQKFLICIWVSILSDSINSSELNPTTKYFGLDNLLNLDLFG